MLRNYLAAAIRNLFRNRLYSALNIAGLALGFTASLLIALYVHDEMSFDRFWPHYQQAYMVHMAMEEAGSAPVTADSVPAPAIELLKQRLPAGVVVARVLADGHMVRHGQQEANESISWADPQLFSVLRPVVVAGDLDRALMSPDGLVLTQHIARKFFGDVNPVGQTLTIDREHPLTVSAVVRDIPASSFFSADLFGSAQASFAGLGLALAKKETESPPFIEAFLRLPPSFSHRQAEAALQASADEVLRRLNKAASGPSKGPSVHFATELLPVAAVHLSPQSFSSRQPRGDPSVLAALALIGVAILAMAVVNFVNLMTARATRRATEIGVRKAQGARWLDLIAQFMGESLLYCVLAMLAAFAAVELLLPAFNGFLHREIVLSYETDLAACAAVAIVTGAVAGFYPALVLARFRPAAVLRGIVQVDSGGRVRQTLVMLQIAVLISLTLATLVVQRQVQFALNEGLRFDKQQLLVISTACKSAFPDEVRKLRGVRAAACSGWMPLGSNWGSSEAVAPGGTRVTVHNTVIAPGLLELLGVHPLAGRFFSAEHPDETMIRNARNHFAGPVVINETALRKLHFSSPQAAIGQVLRHPRAPGAPRTEDSQIIGVAPDVPEDTLRQAVEATVFSSDAAGFQMLAVKLEGRQVPETLSAIDALWKKSGEPRLIARMFVDQEVQEIYEGEMRQGQMFAVFSGIALLIACLGLAGLAAFTAQRRTKEIGVRKALGASRGQVVWMLLWELTRPVLLANLIAWPVGLYLMSRWLAGFAYHIQLSWWMFAVSGLLAVLIAWAAVSSHAFLMARARPASALRYE